MSCLCFPQFCSTRAELVINPHHGIPPDRNQAGIIGVDLPAFLLSKSSYPEPVRAANIPLALSSFPVQLRTESPENKKPGVERRAKPPFQWLCAKLDIFLACARNEPHYRIYFWPSLDLTLGRTFFDPTVMPLKRSVYPRAICKYTGFSRFVKPSQQLF